MRRYMRLPAMSVCLFVSKITQKRVHGFGWNVACRKMSGHGRTDQLLSPIRIIVRMPEPDCFLRYRISAARRICRCSEPWFYNGFTAHRWPQVLGARRSRHAWFSGVETPLSDVNALYRVPIVVLILYYVLLYKFRFVNFIINEHDDGSGVGSLF